MVILPYFLNVSPRISRLCQTRGGSILFHAPHRFAGVGFATLVHRVTFKRAAGSPCARARLSADAQLFFRNRFFHFQFFLSGNQDFFNSRGAGTFPNEKIGAGAGVSSHSGSSPTRVWVRTRNCFLIVCFFVICFFIFNAPLCWLCRCAAPYRDTAHWHAFLAACRRESRRNPFSWLATQTYSNRQENGFLRQS